MTQRIVAIVLALVMALPALPALPPWRPDPAPDPAAHAKACCCTPCPGASLCPCGHGPVAQELCGTAKDPTPDAAPAPMPPPAPRLAVAPPGRLDVPGHVARLEEDVERPAFRWSSPPPDKVPIV